MGWGLSIIAQSFGREQQEVAVGHDFTVHRHVQQPARTLHGVGSPDLTLEPSIGLLDIALVDGPLLADFDFITDYSESTPAPTTPHLRRYCALTDRMGAERIHELRRIVVRLLSGLAEDLGCGPSWVLWTKHDDGDLDLAERYYSIRAFVDIPTPAGFIDLNGEMIILEIERNDLGDYQDHFGDYDRIVGLASPNDAIATVLRSLHLSTPLPTTRRHRSNPMSADLLEAGTRFLWVVRLQGPRRVEVHEPGRPMRTLGPGEELRPPGILHNPVPVQALYDRQLAHELTLRNLLQRRGYETLDAVRDEGRDEGHNEGYDRGRNEGYDRGRSEGSAQAVLDVLEARGIGVGTEVRVQVLGARDPQVLRGWLTHAITASPVEDVFAADQA